MSNLKLEKNVLKDANKIITTNRRVKELIISRYGNVDYNEVKIIPHGYDQEDFDRAREEKLPLTDKMRVTYSGSFYTRNPKYYLESIKIFFEKHPDLKGKVEFCFIGTVSKDNNLQMKNLGIEEHVNILGYINHLECVKYLLASDILFLMISRGKNDDAAMPGKVGEYIGSRKNIIASIPEGVTKKMLEKYNAIKFIDDEDPEKIAEAVFEYYRLYKNNELPEANEEVVQQYNRKNLTYDLAKEFNLLLDIE